MLRLALLLSLATAVICGPSERLGRIVGGQNAVPGQFPYQASLRNRAASPPNHFCGAFIINSRWVGTSYRCTFWRQPAENISVVVGSVLLSSGGSTHQAIRIVEHPEYRSDGFGTYENDISLIQVATSFIFSSTVAPVVLGTRNIGGGVNGILAGWGRLADDNLVLPDNLQYKRTTTLTNADSRSRLPEFMYEEITDRTFCSFTAVGQGSCFGDAGGVLIDSYGEAIGIASFGSVGSRCAIMPDCYTRISSFVPWILSYVQTT